MPSLEEFLVRVTDPASPQCAQECFHAALCRGLPLTCPTPLGLPSARRSVASPPPGGLPVVVAAFAQTLSVLECRASSFGPRLDVVHVPDRRIAPGNGARVVADPNELRETGGEEPSARIAADKTSRRIRVQPSHPGAQRWRCADKLAGNGRRDRAVAHDPESVRSPGTGRCPPASPGEHQPGPHPPSPARSVA